MNKNVTQTDNMELTPTTIALPGIREIKIDDGNSVDAIYIDDKQYNELSSISLSLVNGDWRMNSNKVGIDDMIIANFIIQRPNIAWDMIEDNIEIIDYGKIKKNQYFRINPNATKTFKCLHDNCIIDDREYAFYNVITSHLDQEFWDKYIADLKCKNFTDICKIVNESYAGLDNDDIPLVEFGEYERSLMEKYLTKYDKLDDFVYDNGAFLFPVEVLFNLIENGNFSNEYRVLYLITHIINEDDKNVWKKLWDLLFLTSRNKPIGKKIEEKTIFALDTDASMFSFLEYVSNSYDISNNDDIIKSDIEFIKYLIVNSSITPFYVKTIDVYMMKLYEKLDNINISISTIEDAIVNINIIDYLENINMGLIPSYKLSGLSTYCYMPIEFSQDPTYVVWNATENLILFGYNIYDANEFVNLVLWNEFKDDPSYEYHEMTDFEKSLLENKFNNNKRYYDEFMYAMLDLISFIKE